MLLTRAASQRHVQPVTAALLLDGCIVAERSPHDGDIDLNADYPPITGLLLDGDVIATETPYTGGIDLGA